MNEIFNRLNKSNFRKSFQLKKTDFDYINKKGKTVVLKIKYGDFTQITRSLSVNNPIASHEDIRINIYNLFKNIEHNHQGVRLIGVTLSNLIKEEVTNISLFEYINNIENEKK